MLKTLSVRLKKLSMLSFFALYMTTILFFQTPKDPPTYFLLFGLVPMFIWVSVEDQRSQTIPDRATIIIFVMGAIYLSLVRPSLIPSHMAAGGAVLALLWLAGEVYFRWRGVDGLGIGDAKLLGAGIFILGPGHIADLVFVSSVGGVVGYTISALRRPEQQDGIAFGPFIAYAIFLLILYQGDLI